MIESIHWSIHTYIILQYLIACLSYSFSVESSGQKKGSKCQLNCKCHGCYQLSVYRLLDTKLDAHCVKSVTYLGCFVTITKDLWISKAVNNLIQIVLLKCNFTYAQVYFLLYIHSHVCIHTCFTFKFFLCKGAYTLGYKSYTAKVSGYARLDNYVHM